jgi:hypothetical protein
LYLMTLIYPLLNWENALILRWLLRILSFIWSGYWSTLYVQAIMIKFPRVHINIYIYTCI